MKKVSQASGLPFLIETRKLNYPQWCRIQIDIHDQCIEPSLQCVAYIEIWSSWTWIIRFKVADILTNYTLPQR